jgi:WD40 repeat protein
MKKAVAFFALLLSVSIVSAVESNQSYTLKIQNELHNATFSPDSHYLYLRNGKFIEMWDTQTIKVIRKFPIESKDWWENVSIDIRKNYLMIAEQKTIKIWDLSSAKLLQYIKEKNTEEKIYAAAFDTQGNVLYSVETQEEYKINLWDRERNSIIDKTDTQFLANNIEICNPDTFITYNETRMAMYNYQTNKLLWKIKLDPSDDYIYDAQCSNNTKSVYVGSNRLIKINSQNGKMIPLFSELSVFSISKNQKYILTVDSENQNIELRLMKTNQILRKLPYEGSVDSAVFSEDEKNIVIGIHNTYNTDKGQITEYLFKLWKL